MGDAERRWYATVEDGIADHLARIWTRPDNGIWESREKPQHGNFPKTISHGALINTALRLNGVIPKRASTDRAVAAKT